MTALADVAPAVSPRDPVNRAILEISEDQIRGFHRDPIGEMSRLSGIDAVTIMDRIRAMLSAGTIRRVRQTLTATNLAQGALIAWKVPEEGLERAFDWVAANDPFSGHVVIRSGENGSTSWRLWTTLKVPTGFSVDRHCDFIAAQIGAAAYRVMPPLRVFALGVGHMRRDQMKVGEMAPELAEAKEPAVVDLNELDWLVLMELKRDFAANEICRNIWAPRAEAAAVPLETFFTVAEGLDRKGVLGRFSTFLEHAKPVAGEERLLGFNGLFHWAVPPGREIEAGRQIGRFRILTHCYWRDGGPELNNVNIMAVAHGTDKGSVMAHKAAIDQHLDRLGIGIAFTTVYWGGRAEIRPSEISPYVYRHWATQVGIPLSA
jgi:DNA-binding Lrp family transcriptional regulator